MKQLSSCLLGEISSKEDSDTTVSQLFEELLSSNPQLSTTTALVQAETKETLSYGELNKKANALARVLIQHAEQHPSTETVLIGLRFNPDACLVVTLLAIQKAGLAYVPLAPNWPEGRVQHVLDEAHPIMVITNIQEESRFSKEITSLFVNYKDLIEKSVVDDLSTDNLNSDEILNSSVTSNRLFAVLYTSGSTGRPKGARIVQRAVLNRFFWYQRCFPYSQDDVCVFKTTLTFVDSVAEIWSPLLSGLQLVIVPAHITQNLERFLQVLEDFRITRIYIIASVARSILTYMSLKKGKQILSSLQRWECTAETLTKDILMSFFEFFPSGKTISNFYGSTESMGDVTFITFHCMKDVQDLLYQDKVPIGFPVDNCKAYILDENLQPVKEGNIGGLYVSGKNLSSGYLRDEIGYFVQNHFTKTKGNCDDDKMYKTGDYARIVNNSLYYEGRLDSQIKVNGQKIDLSEIERVMYDVVEASKVSVLCYKPGETGQKILCYYIPSTGISLHEHLCIEALKRVLPPYALPKLIQLSRFPVLVNGKTDRQQLLKLYSDTENEVDFSFSEEDLSEYVDKSCFEPALVLLESIVKIIPDGKRKPKLSDNFFQMGGDSLNLVAVLSEIYKQGYQISLTDFVSMHTLADVAKTLVEVKTNIATPSSISCSEVKSSNKRFKVGNLDSSHKKVVIDMVSRCFAEKGALDLLMDVGYEVHVSQNEAYWEDVVAEGLSIVVYNDKNEIVGASLNFDAASSVLQVTFDDNSTECEGNPDDVIVDFLDRVEYPIKERYLPKDMGKTVYIGRLATADFLSPAENVEVTLLMEEAMVMLAKKNGYSGLYTTNTNNLMHYIARKLEYKILSSIQVNKYIDPKGKRPFKAATDDLVVEIAMKTF